MKNEISEIRDIIDRQIAILSDGRYLSDKEQEYLNVLYLLKKEEKEQEFLVETLSKLTRKSDVSADEDTPLLFSHVPKIERSCNYTVEELSQKDKVNALLDLASSLIIKSKK